MSKIESAFLKAMKETQQGKSSQDEPKESILDKFDYAVPRKKETKDLVSSRKQISKMSQDELFKTIDFHDKRLIFSGMKDKILLNKYRNLRTRLLASCPEGKTNFITLVTSVVPKGGSSLIATNLASAFAFDEGKTATLIDANIQSPALNRLLDVETEKGLTEYLESEDWSVNEVLYKTSIPRLRFVPSGLVRENSAEYFTSDKMKEFVSELVKRYPDRYPIIDAPSISESADTRILIELCDRVILVVPYGNCTEEEIKYAALAIGEEKLAGVVLNQF